MAVRLEPADEYMHELGPEPNFNESMYFNVYDPSNNLGGWFRIGNRANEGYAEMTVCLYLPDGRVGFQFKRASIMNNDRFDAGGMTINVGTPFEELSLGYEGKVVLLTDPLEMVEPKVAFTNNPFATCSVDLKILGRSAMFGGEPDTPHEAPGEEFAKGHYEQLHEAVGTIRVGDTTWTVQGFGLRDHSWGPRYWQAPWYYRWLTGNAGPDFGFMGSFVAKKPGSGSKGSQGGFVWEDGKLHLVDAVDISTSWTGDATYHRNVHLTLSSSRSAKQWRIEGEVMNLIPLRNRRTTPEGDELLTRISEGMTRWSIGQSTGSDDGPHDGSTPTSQARIGYGLSEYLDQIIDAMPVGIDH